MDIYSYFRCLSSIFAITLNCNKSYYLIYYNSRQKQRGVAQFGSARGLGPWGRGFKSSHPDHLQYKDEVEIINLWKRQD